MIRACLQSKALFVLVAVFAGALLLATNAHAENYHIPGVTGGRSSATGGRGAVPGVCDPVRPAVGAPAPAPAPAPIAQPPAPPTQRLAANEDGPRGKNEPAPEKKDEKAKPETKSGEESEPSNAKAKAPEAKPALSPAKLAKLTPKEKIAALLDSNGCIGCHKPDGTGRELFKANGDYAGELEKSEIADMLLGKTDVPDEMKSAVKNAQNALSAEDKELLKSWHVVE